MYSRESFGTISLVIFKDEVTSEQLQNFADDMHKLAEENSELFVVVLPLGNISYPKKLAEIVQALKSLRSATGKIQRLYGMDQGSNQVLTFFANLGSQMLGLGSKVIAVKSMDDLRTLLLKDARAFTTLSNADDQVEALCVRMNDLEAEKIA